MFLNLNSFNLRALTYGCQKCRDIFQFINDEHIVLKKEIEKIIFFGIIAFAQRRSKGENTSFDNNSYLSAKLGYNNEFPLFKFCYDYIVYQMVSKEEVEKSTKYYSNYLINGKWNSGKDKDLDTIRNFYLKTEKEVVEAIKNINNKVERSAIPYHDYGVLVNYIVAIRYDAEIEFDDEAIYTLIIESLKAITIDTIDFESLFNSSYSIESEDGAEKFDLIKRRMKDAIDSSRISEFSYRPFDIQKLYLNNFRNIKKSLKTTGFSSQLDVDTLSSIPY